MKKIRFLRPLALVIVLLSFVSLEHSLGAGAPIDPRARTILPAPIGRPASPSSVAPAIGSTRSWARAFGNFFPGQSGWESDIAMAAVPARDGGVVVAGVTYLVPDEPPGAPERSSVVVMEVRPSSAVDWVTVFPADASRQAYNDVFDLISTSDGGYVAVGWVSPEIQLARQSLVMKLGPRGGVQWIKSYDTGEHDCWATDVVEMPDGGFVVAGDSASHAFLLRIDAAGSLKWSQRLGLWSLGSLEVTPSGGFMACGYGGDGVARLILFDSQGKFLRQEGFALDPGWGCGDYDSHAYRLCPTAEGGYALAGETWGCSRASWDAWVCVVDEDGALARFQSFSFMYPQAFFQTKDGGYLLADYQSLLKLTPDLEIEWQRGYANCGFSKVVETEDSGFLIGGNYRYNEGADIQMAVLRQDSFGRIGPSCPLIAGSQIEPVNSIMNLVTPGPFLIQTQSIKVRTLTYAPHARTCDVTALCDSAVTFFPRPLRRIIQPEARSRQRRKE